MSFNYQFLLYTRYKIQNLWISTLALLYTNCMILGKALYSETIRSNDQTFQIDFTGPDKDRMR